MVRESIPGFVEYRSSPMSETNEINGLASSPVFVTSNGEPLQFYISLKAAERWKLQRLIESNGGKNLSQEPTQPNQVICISDFAVKSSRDNQFYRSDYVRECVSAHKVLEKNDYLISSAIPVTQTESVDTNETEAPSLPSIRTRLAHNIGMVWSPVDNTTSMPDKSQDEEEPDVVDLRPNRARSRMRNQVSDDEMGNADYQLKPLDLPSAINHSDDDMSMSNQSDSPTSARVTDSVRNNNLKRSSDHLSINSTQYQSTPTKPKRGRPVKRGRKQASKSGTLGTPLRDSEKGKSSRSKGRSPRFNNSSTGGTPFQLRSASKRTQLSQQSTPTRGHNFNANIISESNPRISEKLKTFIEEKTREFEVDYEIVLYALMRTSGDTKLSTLVLRAYTVGAPLPTIPGVWSENDDVYITKKHSIAIARLSQRHGEALLNKRVEFLHNVRL